MELLIVYSRKAETTWGTGVFFSYWGMKNLFSEAKIMLSSIEGLRSENFGGVKKFKAVVWDAPALGKGEGWDELLRDPFYQPHLKKTLTYGIKIPFNLKQEGNEKGLSRFGEADLTGLIPELAQCGSLGAADSESLTWLQKAIPRRPVFLTGLSDLHAVASALNPGKKRNVFCPPDIQDCSFEGNTPKLRKRVQTFYRWLCGVEPTLFLAQKREDLAFGAMPGLMTFISPRFPEHYLRAISSANVVLTGLVRPAFVGIGNGVPVFSLGFGKPIHWVQTLGIPSLHLADGSGPADWADKMAGMLREYPWDEINNKRDKMERATCDAFRQLGLVPPREVKKHPVLRVVSKPNLRKSLHLCSISDTNYLPFLLGFMENAVEVHSGPITFHILVLENNAKEYLENWRGKAQLCLYTLEDLWEPAELPSINSRRLGFKAFSSKPRLILKALNAAKKPIFYCDSDIHFFCSPAELESRFGGNTSVLLFPHWNDAFPEARQDGLFNAGMIAAAPGAEGFLRWWSELCFHQCTLDNGSGVVGDQAYLDFAPLLFDGVSICRDGDQNVARWNLKSLGVKLSYDMPRQPRLSNGKPVQSYHAAFIDEQGIFESKYCWDQLVTFFSGFDPLRIGSSFSRTLIAQQQHYWLELSRARLLKDKLSKVFYLGNGELKPTELRFLFLGLGRYFLPVLACLSSVFRRRNTVVKQCGSSLADVWVKLQHDAFVDLQSARIEKGGNESGGRENHEDWLVWDYSHRQKMVD